ncbi:assembly protein for periplasmic nitrate reductase [Ruegeria denitrificans]|uniref:Chaperone NapD n=1 Tax=Ruegeria denitrificans TaxID=1715692 RepID=A0A0P1I937_9RHOB|nr:chaperone NapD [Ruegeria denitrificans]CUJ99071.1 assembly protein for periplasmic nitrate reductase [Ruegeria denitrificans]
MNICGCLVHIIPDRAEVAAQKMRDTPGVEVHAQAEDGRFVVVVEDTSDQLASEIIMDLHQIPGVVSLTLTYHHFEDLAETPSHPDAQSQTTSRRLTL